MPKLIRRKTTIVRGRSTKSWNNWFGRLSGSQQQFLKTYFFHLAFLFFLANYVVVRQLQLTFFAQSCMSREMVAADNRCLYIYGGQVYEKGSKSKPHKGQKCGTDVTTIIPSFHTREMARYMDPNLVGTICSGQPAATPTSKPTNTTAPQPTSTKAPTQPPPAPTATRVPTQPPVAPTATRAPTSPPSAPTLTLKPNQPTIPPQPTNRLPTATPRVIGLTSPTATRTPTQKIPPTKAIGNLTANPTAIISPTVYLEPITNNRPGFGRYLSDEQMTSEKAIELPEEQLAVNSPLKPMDLYSVPTTNNFLILLAQTSQILVGASFILLVITTLATVLRKIQSRFTK